MAMSMQFVLNLLTLSRRRRASSSNGQAQQACLTTNRVEIAPNATADKFVHFTQQLLLGSNLETTN